jgi:hypothetical protein
VRGRGLDGQWPGRAGSGGSIGRTRAGGGQVAFGGNVAARGRVVIGLLRGDVGW